MLIQSEGNLFRTNHEAFAHGVSNKGRMDRGIAVEFRLRYPAMFGHYLDRCLQNTLKPGDVYFYRETGKPSVFNLVTQENLNYAKVEYLKSSIRQMHMIALANEITDIGMPEIGCGLGGLGIDDLILALQPFVDDSKHHVTIWHL